MVRPRRVFAVLLLTAAPFALAADPPPLPRYHLQKGQHLVYRGESHFKYDTGSLDSKSTDDVWVTGTKPDGSADLLVLTTSDRGQGPPSRELHAATLSPTGQVKILGHSDPGTNLSHLFPPLPPTEGATKSGWQSEPDDFGAIQKFTVVPDPAPAGVFVFKGVDDAVEDKIYLSGRSTTYRFDTGHGLLDRAGSQNSQDYGFHGKGTGTTTLQSSEMVGDAALKQLTADADAYFNFAEALRSSADVVAKNPQGTDLVASAAQRLTEAQQATIASPAIKEVLADKLTEYQKYLPYLKEHAEKRAAILNKPAPEFATTDMDGKPVRLSDFRGKVVVLDFWYRGCGWCIRAMPQVKQLANDFRGQPVAVLGMNTDREPGDAQFVVKAMSLNYPTLKAESLPEQFKVSGFPTLLIIDQQGVVRDIHEGWSPTLRKDVGDKIRSLLGKGQSPTS
jgi:thiol-disulfide isomerase/thioredoxin